MTGRGWSFVVAGCPLVRQSPLGASRLVGVVALSCCVRVVRWGGWGRWWGRHMVGWLGGFMLVCGLGGLGVLLLAVGSPVLWVLLVCGLCVWVVSYGVGCLVLPAWLEVSLWGVFLGWWRVVPCWHQSGGVVCVEVGVVQGV